MIYISRGDDYSSGWSKITTPTTEALEVCRASSNDAGCHQALYSEHGLNYSSVCGMAKGYQKGIPDGFEAYTLLGRCTTLS